MKMLDAIESSTPDVEEVMSKKLSQRPWRAHEAQVFELVEDLDNPTNPYRVETLTQKPGTPSLDIRTNPEVTELPESPVA